MKTAMLSESDIKAIAAYIKTLIKIEQRLRNDYNKNQLEVT